MITYRYDRLKKIDLSSYKNSSALVAHLKFMNSFIGDWDCVLGQHEQTCLSWKYTRLKKITDHVAHIPHYSFTWNMKPQ